MKNSYPKVSEELYNSWSKWKDYTKVSPHGESSVICKFVDKSITHTCQGCPYKSDVCLIYSGFGTNTSYKNNEEYNRVRYRFVTSKLELI